LDAQQYETGSDVVYAHGVRRNLLVINEPWDEWRCSCIFSHLRKITVLKKLFFNPIAFTPPHPGVFFFS